MQCYPLNRGRWRLFNFLRRHITGIAMRSDTWGNRFILNLDNHIDSLIYLTAGYEIDEILEFYECVKTHRCRQFIDIGANIGCYTLFFAGVREIERIYAFEPDPVNYAQFQGNLWLNGRLDSVTAFPFALSESNGTADFQRIRRERKPGAPQYNSGTGSLTYKHPERADCVQIQVRKFDDLLSFQGERIAIKIDVEGHENSVLRGMEACLRANYCLLLVEATLDPAGLDRWLKSLGYERSATYRGDNWVFSKKPLAPA